MLTKKLETFRIILLSIIVTLIGSVQTIIQSLIGHWTRNDYNKMLHRWASRLIRIVHISLKVVNPNHITIPFGKPCILMSNHASHYDIPLILLTFPHQTIRMVTKSDLFKVPIWGRAMKACEFLSIDRTHGRQALKDLQVAQEKLKSGVVLWVSPEGTRTRSGHLGKFKKGVFVLAQQMKAIIIPIGIRGSYNVLPPDTLNFKTNQSVEVHIGVPIDSTQYDEQNLTDLMQKVEVNIRQLCAELVIPRPRPREPGLQELR